MGYETILFDIDDTLLDFKAAEEQALSQLFQDMGVEPSLSVKNNYKKMNQGFWRDHEAGLLSRQELLDNRFRLFFEQYEREVDFKQPRSCRKSESEKRSLCSNKWCFCNSASASRKIRTCTLFQKILYL